MNDPTYAKINVIVTGLPGIGKGLVIARVKELIKEHFKVTGERIRPGPPYDYSYTCLVESPTTIGDAHDNPRND